MTNDKIMRIVLAAAVLLGLSWPAAAQQRAQGTAARLDLTVAPFTAAIAVTEAESVGLSDDLEAAEPDAESTDTAESTVEADELLIEGSYGPDAISSWGFRTDGEGSRSRVRTIDLKMTPLSRKAKNRHSVQEIDATAPPSARAALAAAPPPP